MFKLRRSGNLSGGLESLLYLFSWGGDQFTSPGLRFSLITRLLPAIAVSPMLYMTTLRHLLISLLLSGLFCFGTPLVLLGSLLILLVGLQTMPGMAAIATVGLTQLLEFLKIFGNGNIWEGLWVIGLSWGLVGVLFDLYIFCQYQMGEGTSHQ